MKGSQHSIKLKEKMEESEDEWEERGHITQNGAEVDYIQPKSQNGNFFECDYEELKEKKYKFLENHLKSKSLLQGNIKKYSELNDKAGMLSNKKNGEKFKDKNGLNVIGIELNGKLPFLKKAFKENSQKLEHSKFLLKTKFIEDNLAITESNDPKIDEKIEKELSLSEDNFNRISSSEEGKGYPNKFKECMNIIRRNISEFKVLLNKKRKNAEFQIEDFMEESNGQIFNEYDVFVLNFYNECKNFNTNPYEYSNSAISVDDMKSLNFNQNSVNNKSYLYLFNKMKDYVLYNKKKQNKLRMIHEGKKLIGITPEDILKEEKYQVDFQNLPKFSRTFEKLTSDIEYRDGRDRIYTQTMIESAFETKQKKKQQTLSFIELQNKEAFRAIEEKRQKFKHLPKSNKEKMDNNNLHKHWNWIVKKDIPKMYKIYQKYKTDMDYNCKKFSTLCQKEVKKKVVKVQRLQKESNLRAKRLQKEMLVFWRKRDKEILEIKKKKDKYEIEKKKKEDEIQEMIIQKKRLEYLMKQSDIYSFFMIRNMGMIDQIEQEGEPKSLEIKTAEEKKLSGAQTTVIGNNEVLVNPKNNKVIFQSIKVEIDENAAKEDVKQIIKKQREKMNRFDVQTNKLRETLGGDQVKTKKLDEPSDFDLQLESLDKPMITNVSSQLIEAPSSFMGELKEYQLKGLRWLDNLYDQGINGILADEMGLGKTIQAISFLSHLSEEKNNWGPFLVVAPNATLYNWQQEVNRFCPSLKVLPYWGGLKERKTLRKFFNSSNLYTKMASFHVCITSYQLVVSDERVFHRVNWQYMILDEAQAIKNINSQRWNTLLSFNCRNRLLLSGTPIQNSMSELWALLHFIMPNLFDSHEQFQEWFSKDIEAHSQEKGELNQEQLNRLHKILKPFMLRRIKKDVEHEIGPKVEYEILCEMTERQKILYNSIKEKLSNISDLFTSVDSKVKVENLMNLVMQFRKVCNHPELFERNFGKVPFIFRDLEFSRTCTFISMPNSIPEIRTNDGNCIQYVAPKLIYDECFEMGKMLNIQRNYNIFTLDNIIGNTIKNNGFSNLFSFIGLLKFSVQDFYRILNMDRLLAQMCLAHYLNEQIKKHHYYRNQTIFNEDAEMNNKFKLNIFINSQIYPYNEDISSFYRSNPNILFSSPLIVNTLSERKDNFYREFNKHRFYIPQVISPQITLSCSSNRVQSEVSYNTNNLVLNKILYGRSFRQLNVKEFRNMEQYLYLNQCDSFPYIEEILENGALINLFYKNEGFSQIELPSFERLVADCAKLKKLDELLVKLKKENHRVLIFCQMTRMIDILEEYMAKRRYTYFRMDGSTNIADRRDMVNEFQVNPKIFAFLLSTRAGGLGVNLTGADTVIFYDNDWNPTMDAQATDRAHRIGQTKVVSVYRLITKGTIEERILKRAKQKQNVQTTVYSGGAFKADIFKQSEIVELLYSEEEVQKMGLDRKKIIGDIHNNNTTTDNFQGPKDVTMNLSNSMNMNEQPQVDMQSTKGKKKTSNKKGKKDSKSDKPKKGKNKGEASGEQNIESNNKTINPGKIQGQNNRNIFAVSSGVNDTSHAKTKINALKVDSSDDENNIIIQDGDNPIQIDEENDMYDG